MLNFFWGIVKAPLISWLTNRSLVLPAVQVAALSKKLGVDPSVIVAVDAAIVAELPGLLNEVKF